MASDEFAELHGWLKILYQEVYEMRYEQFIFSFLWKLITENPELQKRPSHLYAWLHDLYAEAMAMSARRLTDTHPKAISLAKLLRRLKGNPGLLSRQHYESLFPAETPVLPSVPSEVRQHLRRRILESGYDATVGKGLAVPTVEQFETEITKLQELTNSLSEYASKRIAHYDKEPPTTYPTLDDVDAVIEYADELIRKYTLLFEAVSTELKTYFQYDWAAPLRIPWLT